MPENHDSEQQFEMSMSAPSRIRALNLIVCMTCLASAEPPSANSAPPAVHVESVERAFHNGEHNAFTDLCRFGDKYYLTGSSAGASRSAKRGWPSTGSSATNCKSSRSCQAAAIVRIPGSSN